MLVTLLKNKDSEIAFLKEQLENLQLGINAPPQKTPQENRNKGKYMGNQVMQTD